MNQYKELREKQQKEFNAFPMFFAFSSSQFEEGMKKLGLNPEDTDKIYGTGSGGYYRKTDSEAFSNLLNKFDNELDEAIKADTDGTGFVYDMFLYEMTNHEYCYTEDDEEILSACGMTLYTLDNNPVIASAFKKAKADL